MLVLKERVVNVPVMSLQTGDEIARTEKPIIDPRQLTIVAFYCQGSKLDVQPAILHIDDIREAGGLGFIVDSADVIMSPNDLVRLQPILRYNFVLEGKQVIDDTGRKIGKVSNYTVDTRSFYITQLQVQPSIWHAWNTSEVLVNRTQIIEISDSHIVVRAATINSQEREPVKNKIVENPFKQPRPQTEASHAGHDD